MLKTYKLQTKIEVMKPKEFIDKYPPVKKTIKRPSKL